MVDTFEKFSLAKKGHFLQYSFHSTTSTVTRIFINLWAGKCPRRAVWCWSWDHTESTDAGWGLVGVDWTRNPVQWNYQLWEKFNVCNSHCKVWKNLVVLKQETHVFWASGYKIDSCLYLNAFYTFCSSVQFSRSVVSDSWRPHESQHARPPCPSPTPGVHSDSRPSSQWCHPAISSSVVPFSSCPQSLPGSGSFPMSHI